MEGSTKSDEKMARKEAKQARRLEKEARKESKKKAKQERQAQKKRKSSVEAAESPMVTILHLTFTKLLLQSGFPSSTSPPEKGDESD
jgi:hypothetical protein